MFRALIDHRQGARNIPSVVCAAPPDDDQVMLETCRGS
jgi:hypothetical protein